MAALNLSQQASKALALGSYFVSGVLAINASQLLGGPLTLVNKEWYDAWVAYTKQSFGLLITTLTQYWAPTVIRVSGDKSVRGQLEKNADGELVCRFPDRLVMIANHQIYTDWLYLWHIAYCNGMHGRIFIVLKESLRRIPVIGWGMQLYQFIFLKRNWEKDKAHLAERMQMLNKSKDPMWLLMFPEGTNLAESTREKSKKWAKKNGIADMRHQLLPRSTGLQFCLQQLRQTVGYVYDCTIAYEGVPSGEYAQDIFTLRASYYEGKPPKSVNLHWRRFAVKDIPLNDTKAFEAWMLARWREKDLLLDYFEAYGRFPADTGSEKTPDGKTIRGAGLIEAEVKTNAWYDGLQIFAPVGLLALVLFAFYGALPRRMVKHIKNKNTNAMIQEMENLQNGKVAGLAQQLLGTGAPSQEDVVAAQKTSKRIASTVQPAAKRPRVTAPTRAVARKPAVATKASKVARPRSPVFRRAPSPMHRAVHLPKTQAKRATVAPARTAPRPTKSAAASTAKPRPKSPTIRKAPIKRVTPVIRRPVSRPTSRNSKATNAPKKSLAPPAKKAPVKAAPVKAPVRSVVRQSGPTKAIPARRSPVPAPVRKGLKPAVKAASPKPAVKKPAMKQITPAKIVAGTKPAATKPKVAPVKPAPPKLPPKASSTIAANKTVSKPVSKQMTTPAKVIAPKKLAPQPTKPISSAAKPATAALKLQPVKKPAAAPVPQTAPKKLAPKAASTPMKAAPKLNTPKLTPAPSIAGSIAPAKKLASAPAPAAVKKPTASTSTATKVSPGPKKLETRPTPTKLNQLNNATKTPAIKPVPTRPVTTTAPKVQPQATKTAVTKAPVRPTTTSQTKPVQQAATKPSASASAKPATKPNPPSTLLQPQPTTKPKPRPNLTPIKTNLPRPPPSSIASSALLSPTLSTSTTFTRRPTTGTATPATTVPPTPFALRPKSVVSSGSRAPSVISGFGGGGRRS